MRRLSVLPSLGMVTLALSIAAMGCAKKQTASETTTDSLLASNPQETPSGSISPQSSYRNEPKAGSQSSAPRHTTPAPAPTRTIPSGTTIAVTVHAQISSETANVGDSWTGTVERPVAVHGRTLIPAGR